MIRNTLLASVIALGTAGAAQAQDAGPRLLGGGPDATVTYAEPSENLAGGGRARIVGGGENQRLVYADTTAQPSSGLVAEIIGGGENRRLVYRTLPVRQLAGPAPHQGG